MTSSELSGKQNLLNNPATMLFVASALSLFVELLLIRYIAIEVHIFQYFKNLSLMACFFGIGLGFAWTDRKRDHFAYSGLMFFGLCTILTAALLLHWNDLTFMDPFQFMVFGATQHFNATVGRSIEAMLVILLVFTMTTFTFVGMGQLIGRYFEQFPPLKAYSINVAGALVGTALFSILCWLETPPAVWILTAALLFIAVKRQFSHFALLGLAIAHFALLPHIAHLYYGEDYVETKWSPYYRIDIVNARANIPGVKWGYDLKVNFETFQTILDCSEQNLAKVSPQVRQAMMTCFGYPYQALNIKPKNVLILASGNGSDVSAALRAGAEHVDAVDIDPVITRLGRTLHPEKPYDDPRVSLYVMDARTYLKNCKKKYDLIIFCYLDSHTSFSSLSSLRTDNYIFTVDSYKEAVKLLNDRGIVFVSFICFGDWLWDRHTNALSEAAQMTPISSFTRNEIVGVGYMTAGPGLKYIDTSQIRMPGKPRDVNRSTTVPLATDDWPFLFLPNRQLTGTYGLPLAVVLALSSLFVWKELRSGIGASINIVMLLLGMAFMLLEVRAMSDLSLLFGSTWLVNTLVISGVMAMILLGNLIAIKTTPSIKIIALCLIGSLLVSTLVRPADLLVLGEMGKLVGTVVMLLPAAFAAVLFATFFKLVKKPTEALAFNVFGGLVGVTLEYLSMLFGIRFMGWACMSIYAVALLFALRHKKEFE